MTTVAPTRERIVEAARELFWSRGYEATSVADILDRAEVHSGSLYHYFRGKQDLLLAVLDEYVEMLWPAVIQPVFERVEDPIERVFGILDGYRKGLVLSGFAGGCPIGNLALEVSDSDPEARRRIAENFEGWRAWIRRCLEDAGGRLPERVDRDELATFILTVMEGAVMQARAARDAGPFDASIARLRDYLDHLTDEAAGRARRNEEPDRTSARPPLRGGTE